MKNKLNSDSYRIDKRTTEAKFINQRYESLLSDETRDIMLRLNIPLALACLRFKDLEQFHTFFYN